MDRISIEEDFEVALHRAVKFLREGQIILFPTDTVYGVGGDALRPGIAARIRKLKGRIQTKHFPWLVSDMKMARRHGRFSWRTKRIAKNVWPGPTTLVVHRVSSAHDTVGLRIPDDPWLREVIRAFGRPIIGTSANPTGKGGATTAAEAEAMLPKADAVFDGGARAESPSAVIDCTVHPPKTLRPRAEETRK